MSFPAGRLYGREVALVLCGEAHEAETSGSALLSSRRAFPTAQDAIDLTRRRGRGFGKSPFQSLTSASEASWRQRRAGSPLKAIAGGMTWIERSQAKAGPNFAGPRLHNRGCASLLQPAGQLSLSGAQRWASEVLADTAEAFR